MRRSSQLGSFSPVLRACSFAARLWVVISSRGLQEAWMRARRPRLCSMVVSIFQQDFLFYSTIMFVRQYLLGEPGGAAAE